MNDQPNQCATELARILGEVSALQKDATLSVANRYTHHFRSKESLFAEVRPRLAAAGIFPGYEVIDYKGDGDIVLIHIRITFYHGASGSQVVTSWLGEAGDRGDKATSKAFTTALRTYFDNQFLIGSDDDKGANDYENQPRNERSAPPPHDPEPPKTLRDIGEQLGGVGFGGAEIKAYVDSWAASQGYDDPYKVPHGLIASWLRNAAAMDNDALRDAVNKRLGAADEVEENPYA